MGQNDVKITNKHYSNTQTVGRAISLRKYALLIKYSSAAVTVCTGICNTVTCNTTLFLKVVIPHSPICRRYGTKISSYSKRIAQCRVCWYNAEYRWTADWCKNSKRPQCLPVNRLSTVAIIPITEREAFNLLNVLSLALRTVPPIRVIYATTCVKRLYFMQSRRSHLLM